MVHSGYKGDTQVKLSTGYSGSVVALRIPLCVWHHTLVPGLNLSGGNNVIGKYAEKPQSQPALDLTCIKATKNSHIHIYVNTLRNIISENHNFLLE